MLTLFGVFVALSLGWRAFLYFRSGKPIAGGEPVTGDFDASKINR
ncbi:hypothetical protein QQS45_03535 [Alteriqipengyuania flavescens]|nr:hypothetical protein [Alteriqipengyuania flavescens]WJY19316.1 hypothetical protein QQW98_03530 [Alteriqipengyuania flavescens]WJY25257.1 hypothetical protein QQS45_03535 [Alteriqipengyuania flavescens]